MVMLTRCWMLLLFIGMFLAVSAGAQDESDFYEIITVPTPEGVAFEVGGMALLPDGAMAIAIRKGEIWLLENPCENDMESLRYRIIATALHEPLGLLYYEGDLYTTQRSELTRLRDTDGDRVIDEYETVSNAWGLTGNYHEYAYGPALDGDGRLWVTLNQTLGNTVEKNDNAWRGWGVSVDRDGVMTPMCAGMRSPCGIGSNGVGDVFFTDQQGEWVPTNSLHQLRRGVFYGHAVSLSSCVLDGSPLTHPGKIPSDIPIPDVRATLPDFRLPAVWFPYRKAGMSATGFVHDGLEGRFGPFDDQLFVGDFTMALITRVALEKVNGEYQGAVFNFRRGFQCAIVRMAWGADGSLFVGETNRGWNSAGRTSYGLERVVWKDKTPFEIKTIHAQPNGFELTFTEPVATATAMNLDSYTISSYTYLYHARYGSDEINTQALDVKNASVADDGLSVTLTIDGLREGYVHEVTASGVRSAGKASLLHPTGYYTLNAIPED